MKVFEYVEGDPKPVITLDGVAIPDWWSITAHMQLDRPTRIFVNGQRVTEPTRLIKNGVVVWQDNADDDLAALSTSLRLSTVLEETISTVLEEAIFKAVEG